MRPLVIALALAACLVVGPTRAAGQAQDRPPANPDDVASLDAIMAAVYDVISGPAGEARDWDRFRSLFVDGARLIPTAPAPGGQGWTLQALTPDDYAQRAAPVLEERGFFEREIGRVVERYGPVVHLMSAYESRNRADDPEPFQRGVNSFQLFNDGARWWVVTIYWAGETDANPIPARFLNGGM